MSRPDPIQYAERLYGAIRAANFSPISFLAFGNAVKEGVAMRNMPRIAAEPFMRVVGEMLDLEAQAAQAEDDVVEAEVILDAAEAAPVMPAPPNEMAPAPASTVGPGAEANASATSSSHESTEPTTAAEKRRGKPGR